jgi:hypothetical protein
MNERNSVLDTTKQNRPEHGLAIIFSGCRPIRISISSPPHVYK